MHGKNCRKNNNKSQNTQKGSIANLFGGHRMEFNILAAISQPYKICHIADHMTLLTVTWDALHNNFDLSCEPMICQSSRGPSKYLKIKYI